MGLGKTYVGAEKMHLLNKNVNLIVCQKSKVNDWIDHMREHYDYEVINGRECNDKPTDDRYVLVINYDLLHRRKWLKQLEDFTLLLDESSSIKNPTAKRTKAVLRLNASNVILLSGTPVGGKYEELWSQAYLLGWDISRSTFYNHFIITELVDYGGIKFNKVVGYKNIDRFKSKLKEHGAIFKKTDELLDLPLQNEIKIAIDTSREYKKFKKDKIITINDEIVAGDTMLKNMLYLRLLAGAYSTDKLTALKDMIESTSDRLIIFYNFNAELDAIKNIIPKDRAISYINGKGEDLSAYNEHGDSITLIQYQAGAMGKNLQKANKIIYYSLPLSSELFEQSKKRIHRVGQDKPCFYYFLLMDNSIEHNIYKTLQLRQNYTNELFIKEGLHE